LKQSKKLLNENNKEYFIEILFYFNINIYIYIIIIKIIIIRLTDKCKDYV